MALSPASSRGFPLPASWAVGVNGSGDLAITDQFGIEIDSDVVSGDSATLRPSGVTVRGDGATIQTLTHVGVLGTALTQLGLLNQVHSAPADADIGAGQCYMWFDQTNGAGATKLMVKARSADGTVKTATILLA